LLENFQEEIKFLARVKEMKVEKGAKKVANSFQGAVKEIEIYIPKSNLIPDEQERAKREKEKEKIKKQLEIVRRKLNNPDFLKKAPAEIVAREREREKDWLKKLSLLE
jgi:valyl-tRNA synthetase